MRAALVLNGTAPDPALLRQVAGEMKVYAADGGATACLAAGVEPEFVLGDFDSVDPESLPGHWRIVREADQNLTDFEKLLRHLPPGLEEILILGGLGGRLDHQLSNLIVAGGFAEIRKICFYGNEEMLCRVTPRCDFVREFPQNTLLSLLALSPVHGVHATGLKWPLGNAGLGPGLGLGQSNRTEGPVHIRVQKGALWVYTAFRGVIPV